MFLTPTFNEKDAHDVKVNAQSLGEFSNSIYAFYNLLKSEIEHGYVNDELIMSALKAEKGMLGLYIQNTLLPVIKKANKILQKNDLPLVDYSKDTIANPENLPELTLLKYYLSVENIRKPLTQFRIVPIKGFDFFKKLSVFRILEREEKIQSLSYYYVVDEKEREAIRAMFNTYKEKSFYSKISKLHNEYLLNKITGFSLNFSERTQPYNFNFDVHDFKDVLYRIKNNTNNVVNIR